MGTATFKTSYFRHHLFVIAIYFNSKHHLKSPVFHSFSPFILAVCHFIYKEQLPLSILSKVLFLYNYMEAFILSCSVCVCFFSIVFIFFVCVCFFLLFLFFFTFHVAVTVTHSFKVIELFPKTYFNHQFFQGLHGTDNFWQELLI